MILELAGVDYPVRYANYQRNSLIGIHVKPAWRPVWSKAFGDIDEEFILTPAAVLVRGSYLGVVSPTELLVFTTDGAFEYVAGIAETTPVVFGARSMAFVDPSLLLNYQGYDRKVIRDYGTVPGLDEWAVALLFKPSLTEILGVVQFTGGPHRKPPKYYAYRFNLETEGYAWDREAEASLEHAVLSADERTMALLEADNVMLVDVPSGETIKQYKTGLDEPLAVSMDPSGNLLITGGNEDDEDERRVLRAFSPEGENTWEYGFVNLQTEQPAACGTDGRVYVVDAMQLRCLIDGKVAWSSPLKSPAPSWLTITSDNHAIVVNGSLLCYFSPEGEKLFERLMTEHEEQFESPASVDSSGRVFVASDETLYCFK